MEHTNQEENNQSENKLLTWGLIVVIVTAIVIPIYYYLNVEKPQLEKEQKAIVEAQTVEEVIEPVVETITEQENEVVIDQLPIEPEEPAVIEAPKVSLPSLDDSDTWLKQQLSELTWRKELLKLVIDDDMVRRLVVFTDNFAQGNLAYEYSPLTSPNTKFSAQAIADSSSAWVWDDATSRRFSLYVDFLRSFEPERLAAWYVELKPLINEAYAELGYPEQDFSETLQDAIVRVLDMELPKQDVKLVRPSVMFKFEDAELEKLPEAEKLLLRIGKDNLLIIKSFLLEFSDALSRAEAQ